ncbi:serine/threonine-protein kinase Nek3-like isoform X2 [Dreissena polymorpha]|uniref:serine/threonine-protein kinase Nek3-like isoform X2 n=1 Tax=Dreissena polymorpha TaxID=45954 RepID=UPI0022645BF1|nr:serine/threonine-protein kinase Nek3-like isoform X2 [Dreissena polymorpha]
MSVCNLASVERVFSLMNNLCTNNRDRLSHDTLTALMMLCREMADKYNKLFELGSGSFGKAWVVLEKQTGRKCVSKEIQISGLGKKEMDRCVVEVWMLSICYHVNIVRYIQAYVSDGCLNIVMEYASGGDLSQKIEKQNGIHFPQETVLDWFLQVVLALEYIHSKKFLHRDLKPQNVFLTLSGIVKLGDFGIARHLINEDLASTRIGTPLYISPEICEGKPYNDRSDMWAAGCLLFEMCALQVPFHAQMFDSLVAKILKAEYEPLPSQYTDMIEPILCRLLVVNVAERYTAKQILDLPELASTVTPLRNKNAEYRRSRSRSLDRWEANQSESKRSASVTKPTEKKNLVKQCVVNIEKSKGKAASVSAPGSDRDNRNIVDDGRVYRNIVEDGGGGQNGNQLIDNLDGRNNDLNCNDRQVPNRNIVGNQTDNAAEIQASKGSRTYTIKDSAFRKLSAASPALSNTIRQQRFSVSVTEAFTVKSQSSGSVSYRGDNPSEAGDDEVFSPLKDQTNKPCVDSRTYTIDKGHQLRQTSHRALVDALSLYRHGAAHTKQALYQELVHYLGPAQARDMLARVSQCVLEDGQGYAGLQGTLSETEFELLPLVCMVLVM